jgi:hypothetical protein
VRQALVDAGIPAREIAFAQDYDDTRKKLRLQENVRNGNVRVLVGSLMGMGTGWNVQTRLKAAHLVTIPWYPALVEQGVGRILRQGNRFEEIDVLCYMTAGTIEEYQWQLNAIKQEAVEGFFRGGADRMGGDLDSESDQFALLASMTSADPRVKTLADAQLKLQKLQSLERGHLDEQADLHAKMKGAAQDKQYHAEKLAGLRLVPAPPVTRGDAFAVTVQGGRMTERKAAGGALKALARGEKPGEALKQVGQRLGDKAIDFGVGIAPASASTSAVALRSVGRRARE